MLLIYANDVAFAAAHPSSDALCRCANLKAKDVEKAVREGGPYVKPPQII